MGGYENFGNNIALNNDGTIIAIGCPNSFAYNHDWSNESLKLHQTGCVRVYELSNNDWIKHRGHIITETSIDKLNNDGVLSDMDFIKIDIFNRGSIQCRIKLHDFPSISFRNKSHIEPFDEQMHL